MPTIEDIRGAIDGIYRRMHLNAFNESMAQDPAERSELQAESAGLHEELLAAQARLRDAQRGQAEVSEGAAAPASVDSDERAEDEDDDEIMGPTTTGLKVKVARRMQNIPMSVVHLLPHRDTPLLRVSVKNKSNKTRRIKVISYVEGFSASAVSTVEIPSGRTATLDQFPAFFPERTQSVSAMTTAALHVRVADLDGATELHDSYPIVLLARSTWILQMFDPKTGDEIDFSDLLAAWVTPHVPEVFDILRRAADLSTFKAMLGYQTDAAGIREHVRAVFEALKLAGIAYVNSPVAFGNSDGQFLQRLRLPRESIATRSANCIDGTLLMASLLEATAIEPGIVLVPGHAYLAWRPQRPKPGVPDAWEYLETTMIATKTFDEARAAATQRTEDLFQKMKADPTKKLVKIVSISSLRAAGIAPME